MADCTIIRCFDLQIFKLYRELLYLLCGTHYLCLFSLQPNLQLFEFLFRKCACFVEFLIAFIDFFAEEIVIFLLLECRVQRFERSEKFPIVDLNKQRALLDFL